MTVQPVATSVMVNVKQNSPKGFPPSWPTRSISTNPGRALVPLRPGADRDLGLEQRPGLGVRTSLGHQEPAPGGQAPIDGGRAHLAQQLRLGVVHHQLALLAQGHDEDLEHGGQALAGRVAAHPPAHRQGLHQGVGIPGRPWAGGPGRPDPARLSQRLAGVVSVPAGELAQLVQGPGLLRPRPPAIGGRQLLGHCVALSHRELHRWGVALCVEHPVDARRRAL